MAAFTLLLTGLVSLALLRVLLSSFSLYRTYIKVKKIGLPVVLTPLTNRSPIWIIIESYILPLIKCLPFGLGNWTEYCKSGWLFRSNYHERFGPAFIIVSPFHSFVIVSDPEAAEQIFHHRKDFQKAKQTYEILDIFGRSVLSANGEDWQRQRKITTPPFNERNSNLVWRESLSQAGGMIQAWMKRQQDGISSTWADTLTLALNVLMGAGFGKSHSFERDDENPVERANGVYRDTLRFILDNLAVTILNYRYPMLPLRFFPTTWTKAKKADADFRQQMKGMVEEARSASLERGLEGDNLMTALLRSSESEEKNGKSRNSLSDEEIYGNLFIYNLAGHDTTANTLAFAITVLSVHPELQEWLREEIISILGTNSNPEKWEYEKAFPQLKRCLALMYETLRLYPAVTAVPRNTCDKPQKLRIAGKEYQLPSDLSVTISMSVLHTLPKYWGSDALTYRPERWIISPSTSTPPSLPSQLAQETHFQPQSGTFLPWTGGPRICPGKKFSQVEFVAVVACLFGKYKVSPVLLEGESFEEAKKRVMAELEEVVIRVTMSIKNKEKIRFHWVEI